ncbi:glucosamine-6-phosphate deaminase [Hoeflea sp. IMCC20628]|uniref:glucosamine-6-phosphate deaminase n=1 Tax=Hoeflea sp. IMCC20628 TaxID=1620421 RepID=UPI00063B0928|nr:glucosamine-6-phosphate deaminase [Hoeflea sp. IMCC20628]
MHTDLPSSTAVTVRQFASADAASRALADDVTAAIAAKPELILGLPTGKTFIAVYRAMVASYRRKELSFKSIRSFNLDEYLGLSPEDYGSFAHYMKIHFFDHVDIHRNNVHIPSGTADDAIKAAEAYEALIEAQGGIDMQLLGIGRNGHIGFNEPGSTRESCTRVVDLTASTLASNTSDFPHGHLPPTQAITMGIDTILSARRIILLATGQAKAAAVYSALHGPISVNNPASFLRFHGDVTLFADADALSYSADSLP